MYFRVYLPASLTILYTSLQNELLDSKHTNRIAEAAVYLLRASQNGHATRLFNNGIFLRRSRPDHDRDFRSGKCTGHLADFLEQGDGLVFSRRARFQAFR
jgi:hypothetical protein